MFKFFKETIWPAMKFIGNERGFNFLPLIPPAIDLVTNLLGKDKGGTETVQTSGVPSWQEQLGQLLGSKASSGISDLTLGQQYPGSLTAGISPYETQGLDWLQQYLNREMGSTYDLAKTELERTLFGGYDPYTSPYYQALRRGAGRELEDAITKSRREAGYRGQFFSEGAQRDEATLREGTTNYLQQILGQLSEAERQRQYGAIGTGLEFEKYAAGLPLAKAAGAMEYGALPRLLQQEDYEKQYEEWKRARQEPLDVGMQTFGSRVPVQTQDYATAPSAFERIMGNLPQITKSVGSIYDIFKK